MLVKEPRMIFLLPWNDPYRVVQKEYYWRQYYPVV